MIAKDLFLIKNHTFLITGGLGKIGLELSNYIINNKSSVIILDYKKKNDFNKIIKKNPFLKSKAIEFINCDISDIKNVKKNLNKIFKNKKKIDVLINLAALDNQKFNKSSLKKDKSDFINFPSEIVKKSIDVNLLGTLNITQILCKYFLKNKIKGNIINVASTYSIVAPNLNLYNDSWSKNMINKPIDYVISKSSIPNLTRYIATQYGKKSIRCNCLVPHAIFNNHDKNFQKKFSKLSPLGRMCNVEEILGPLIFLASSASSYMTGSVLVVDGGWTAW